MFLLNREYTLENRDTTYPYPSTTFPYQEVSNTFGPMQDYHAALLDSAVKRLSTQSGVEPMYSETYGLDWAYIRKQPDGWIYNNIGDMIKSCLMYDDRIKEVEVEILERVTNYLHLRVIINHSLVGDVTL